MIISAIAQLERDLIAERVKNGIANARAKGKHIGRVRKRNSVLIESLLEAGLSYREISRIAKCSHGSVHAQKLEYKKRKADEAARKSTEEIKKLEDEKVFAAALPTEQLSPETLAKLQAQNAKLTERKADEPEAMTLY